MDGNGSKVYQFSDFNNGKAIKDTFRGKAYLIVGNENLINAFEIDNTLGTEDIAAAVSLYPNPAKNYIHINTALDLQSYQIYDVSGKVVMKNNLIAKKININQLANGVYFLVLSSEKGKVVKKIVKE